LKNQKINVQFKRYISNNIKKEKDTKIKQINNKIISRLIIRQRKKQPSNQWHGSRPVCGIGCLQIPPLSVAT
jgi:hypothetical protein